MADITVSSAVDTFMQSADQAAMMGNLAARVEFKGEWNPATAYTAQQMVTSGSLIAIANAATTNVNPVPLPISDAEFELDDSPTFTSLNAQPYIYSGIKVSSYTGIYQLSEIRVWVPDVSADALYRVVILNNSDQTLEVLEGFTGDTVGVIGWHVISKFKRLLEGGSYTFYLISSKKSGTSTVTGNWNRIAVSNTDVDPASGNVSNNGLQTKVRISDLDNTSTDRVSNFLSTVVPGSTLKIANSSTRYYEYEVVKFTDNTGWYDFDVVLISTGSDGAPSTSAVTITSTNRTAVSANYVKISNTFSGSSVYNGYLKIGTGGDSFDNNAYNVDLKIQKYEKSTSWDVVVY